MQISFRSLLTMILLLSVTGCGMDAGSGKSDSKLTVYLNDFDDMIGPMFEAATGYGIELVQGNGAEIMSRIQAERGNPHWDVVWIDAVSSVHGLGLDGLLHEGFAPDNAVYLKDEFRKLVPEREWYYPTSAHAAGIIVYNTNLLAGDEVPASWDDFADPRLKGAVGMSDPAIAAPAYPFVSWFYQQYGLERGNQYFERWFDNGLVIYPKNPNVAAALVSGEIKAAALQEMNAYALVDQGAPVAVVWPEEGAPAAVRVAAISKSTTKLEAAEAFVNFLLDPAVQQAIIDTDAESYHVPSANGATPKPDRRSAGKLLMVDPLWSHQHEAQIKQWFADYSLR